MEGEFMSQEEVLLAVKDAGKVGLKASLADLCKDGGAIDMEVKELAAQNAVVGVMLGALSPVIKQILTGIADKL